MSGWTTGRWQRFGLFFSLGIFLVAPASAQDVPADFEHAVVFSGLTQPVSIEFAANGWIFVAERRGVVKVFESLDDPTPTVFADLQTNVFNFWDRGMFGLAIHPEFPAQPYVYVLYTLDAPPGETPPVYNDACPSPTGSGCLAGGRLSRLTADGMVMTGPEEVLIENWCQQFPSHSIGDLEFGLDGALYVTGGDGASFNYVDYGQTGNPCGDPGDEGGALRSQDLETPGDPVSFDGCVLRVDPLTGEAMPDNPLVGIGDPDDDRVIAYGLRNPYRFTVHPGSNELWIGDVGWSTYEEINRLEDPLDAVVENFGWPCYEGVNAQGGYDGQNIPICETLYDAGTAVAPHYQYYHQEIVAPGPCGTGISAVTGLAFSVDTGFPADYDDALFFTDYARQCIWVMYAGAGGIPDAGDRDTFASDTGLVVDLEFGPDGALYAVNLLDGTVHRIAYDGVVQELFIRGDYNANGTVNPLEEAIFILAYGFQGGAAPPCAEAADFDQDGVINALTEAIAMLAYGFQSGSPPASPFPDCGPDDTAPDLGCEMHPCF